jgi:hypothetical protein
MRPIRWELWGRLKEDCLVVIMGRSFLFKTALECVFGVF